MNIRPGRVGLSCCVLLLACGSAPNQQPETKVPEVTVAHPVAREVAETVDFTGRTDAAETVNLRARVTGYLLKTPFKEGSEVKQGDVLFEIDPRPYQAELDRAEAVLRQAQARLKLADTTQKRAAALLKQAAGAITQQDYDKTVAELNDAEAALTVARSGVEVVKLNLEFTRVTAPISGRIGRRLVDPGNLVKADDTALATIVSRDPIFVYFDMDERTYLQLRRTVPDEKLTALKAGVALADEKGYAHAAVIDFHNNRIDPQTGTLNVRGVLPNKDHLLLPGMFVRVRLTLGEPHKALLVPEQAVMTNRFSQPYVDVVDDKNQVNARRVKLGAVHDGLREVTEGLKPEEWIIIEGRKILEANSLVKPRRVEVPETKPER